MPFTGRHGGNTTLRGCSIQCRHTMHGPPWALMGQALCAPPWAPLWARPLWARPCGPGPCGPPWAHAGQVLVGHPWALVGRALVWLGISGQIGSVTEGRDRRQRHEKLRAATTLQKARNMHERQCLWVPSMAVHDQVIKIHAYRKEHLTKRGL